MQLLVHWKIGDAAIVNEAIGCLTELGSVHRVGELVSITCLSKSPVRDVALALEGFLRAQRIDRDDFVYLFYPYGDQDIRLHMIKREGRLRHNAWPQDVYL